LIKSPRRRAASLGGPLRPGRRSENRAVAGRSVAGADRLWLHRGALLRSSPPAGGGPVAGARDLPKATVQAPARRRSPLGPSKSRWCAPAVRGPVHRSPSRRFRKRRPGKFSLKTWKGRRVVPRGMPQGRGAFGNRISAGSAGGPARGPSETSQRTFETVHKGSRRRCRSLQ
jgi:hypothetical protein